MLTIFLESMKIKVIFSNPFKNNVYWLEKICGIPILKSLKLEQYSLFFGDENGAKS
jgi:hypothetical protein